LVVRVSSAKASTLAVRLPPLSVFFFLPKEAPQLFARFARVAVAVRDGLAGKKAGPRDVDVLPVASGDVRGM